MPFDNALMRRLQMRHPIVQAPLAGGGDTPALTAAACEAGGTGFLGCAYRTPAQIVEAAKDVRARTSRPFGINLFAPQPEPRNPDNLSNALERAAPFYRELGLPAPETPAYGGDPFAEQFAALLEAGPAAFSVTFGIPPADAIAAAKARGMMVMATATTVAEAVVLERAGMDAIVAQGAEAGGHRGTFAGTFEAGMVGTIALVPQIVDAVKIPVIAAGGITDGRGVAAVLALGASAASLGTAFLACDEAGVPDCYKQAIVSARESETRITRAFSGRPARGIVNRFMEAVENPNAAAAVLPFPLQNTLTRPLRAAAGKAGRAEFLSLWAGQALGLARREKAADMVARIVRETEQALARAHGTA